jgi:hypothetical protein
MGLDAGYGIGSVKPGVCTSTTRPARPASPYTGQIIYETDTTLAKVWNGSAWVDTPPGKANVASPTFTGTVTLPTTVASGVLTATAQPRFLATRSGNLSFTGGNVVVFNATSYNVGSHYNTSNGLFTAPVSGNYIFSASVYQSGAIYQLWFIINGNRERTFGFTNSTDNILPGSSVVYLNTGDTIGITSWSNAESRTIYADGNHTFFRGALIS